MVSFYYKHFRLLTGTFFWFCSSLLLGAPRSPADFVHHIQAPETQAKVLETLREAVPAALSRAGISPKDLASYDFSTGLDPQKLSNPSAYQSLSQEELAELSAVVAHKLTYQGLSALTDLMMELSLKQGSDLEALVNSGEAISLVIKYRLPLVAINAVLVSESKFSKAERLLRARVIGKVLRYFSPEEGLSVFQILESPDWTSEEKGIFKNLLGLPSTFVGRIQAHAQDPTISLRLA